MKPATLKLVHIEISDQVRPCLCPVSQVNGFTDTDCVHEFLQSAMIVGRGWSRGCYVQSSPPLDLHQQPVTQLYTSSDLVIFVSLLQ